MVSAKRVRIDAAQFLAPWIAPIQTVMPRSAMPSSLFMITPLIVARDFSGTLESALDAASFSSVWLRLAPMDERERMALAKTYLPLVQKRGAGRSCGRGG